MTRQTVLADAGDGDRGGGVGGGGGLRLQPTPHHIPSEEALGAGQR